MVSFHGSERKKKKGKLNQYSSSPLFFPFLSAKRGTAVNPALLPRLDRQSEKEKGRGGGERDSPCTFTRRMLGKKKKRRGRKKGGLRVLRQPQVVFTRREEKGRIVVFDDAEPEKRRREGKNPITSPLPPGVLKKKVRGKGRGNSTFHPFAAQKRKKRGKGFIPLLPYQAAEKERAFSLFYFFEPAG